MDEETLLRIAKLVFALGFIGTMLAITFMPERISAQQFTWQEGRVIGAKQVGLLQVYTVKVSSVQECTSLERINNQTSMWFKSPLQLCWISEYRQVGREE